MILRKQNYLFVDGRYTIQANNQSGDKFKILEIPYVWPKNISNIRNSKIGFDPKLFTDKTINLYFGDKVKLVPLEFNFKNKSEKKVNKIFYLNKHITGESSAAKINKIKHKNRQLKIQL